MFKDNKSYSYNQNCIFEKHNLEKTDLVTGDHD